MWIIKLLAPFNKLSLICSAEQDSYHPADSREISICLKLLHDIYDNNTSFGPIKRVPWTHETAVQLVQQHIDGLVQDCSNSTASVLELLQSCRKPSLYDISAFITVTEIHHKTNVVVIGWTGCWLPLPVTTKLALWQPLVLTHWSRVTHKCTNKLTIICSDNGFSPERRQAIIWTKAGMYSRKSIWKCRLEHGVDFV